ncbi:MAG: ribonuclease HIII [Planctomycetota bacterium]|jgi:ribonuclease HIII
MAQDTLVVKLPPAKQSALKSAMDQGDFVFRSMEHAHWSARGEGVIATLYRSGKLVVQGSATEIFNDRFLGGATSAPKKAKAAHSKAAGRPGSNTDGPVPRDDSQGQIGSDETGKGDYFGPLVVVAVRLEPGQREELAASGVMDSKRIDDSTIGRMAPALMERYAYAVERLDPPAYNETHARVRNLNPMLADLHARAIRTLAEAGDHALVDRFAREELVASRLDDLDLQLDQEPRAEADPAVAAASIIARHLFVEGLRELSEEYAVDLRKGAGAPTDAAGREFLGLHGREALGQVAKLHFKNTQKITGSNR